MFCSKCGKSNAASAGVCEGCGAVLANTTGEFTGTADESLRIFVGANQDAYMERFSRFEDNGKIGPSWHWPAFFVMFYWLIYRKMWLAALIFLVAPWVALLAMGMGAAAMGQSGLSLFTALLFPYVLAWIFLPPMYAHAMYYKHAKGKIRKIEESHPDVKSRFAELTRKGGTSNIIAIVAVVFLLVFMIGILAAIAVPQYAEYGNRTKMALAVSTGEKAGAAVGSYFETHQAIPASLAEAGFAEPLPNGLKQIILNTENGSLDLHLFLGVDQLKVIVLMPAIGADGKVSWSCSSEHIEDRLLPLRCRKNKKAR